MTCIAIPVATLNDNCEALRQQVRAFLADTLGQASPLQRAPNWAASDPTFSRLLGQQGWIGMTWPRRHGGAERSALERYVVLEELLAAGAPVSTHWVAERQSGPLLMRHAPDTLAPRILPRITRGECCFAIGMSEPGAGSDLAAIRTRAAQVDGGWRITGNKVWTSSAHAAHYMITLARTSEGAGQRHAGLSQLLVPMDAPGVRIQPVPNLLGEHHFNEVFLDEVFVPDDHLIGREGQGWQQVMEELAFERSGPERYLSSTQLMIEMLRVADANNPQHAAALGRLVAAYGCLRQMSLGVASLLQAGQQPALEAAVVKELGANLEQAIPDVAHELFGGRPGLGDDYAQTAAYTTLAAPSFSLRGGTREVLRGIIGRGLPAGATLPVAPAAPGDELAILIEASAQRLLAEVVTPAHREQALQGQLPAELWQAVQDLGLPWALVGGERGGTGASLAQAWSVCHAMGHWQVPLPLLHTMLAAWLCDHAGLAPAAGIGTLALHALLTLDVSEQDGMMTVSGDVPQLPWGAQAAWAWLPLTDGSLVCIDLSAHPGCQVQALPAQGGEPQARLQLHRQPVQARLPAAGAGRDMRCRWAVMRAAATVGAAESALAQTRQHLQDRQQFGQPLARFQVLAHALADAAAQVAGARLASLVAAGSASGAAPVACLPFDAAVAQVRVAEAATRTAWVAHQLHGAMGFTQAHPLQAATRRLWAWRDDAGGASAWAAELGRAAIQGGAGAFWPAITARQWSVAT